MFLKKIALVLAVFILAFSTLFINVTTTQAVGKPSDCAQCCDALDQLSTWYESRQYHDIYEAIDQLNIDDLCGYEFFTSVNSAQEMLGLYLCAGLGDQACIDAVDQAIIDLNYLNLLYLECDTDFAFDFGALENSRVVTFDDSFPEPRNPYTRYSYDRYGDLGLELSDFLGSDGSLDLLIPDRPVGQQGLNGQTSFDGDESVGIVTP